jgi:hypothetical protein
MSAHLSTSTIYHHLDVHLIFRGMQFLHPPFHFRFFRMAQVSYISSSPPAAQDNSGAPQTGSEESGVGEGKGGGGKGGASVAIAEDWTEDGIPQAFKGFVNTRISQMSQIKAERAAVDALTSRLLRSTATPAPLSVYVCLLCVVVCVCLSTRCPPVYPSIFRSLSCHSSPHSRSLLLSRRPCPVSTRSSLTSRPTCREQPLQRSQCRSRPASCPTHSV